MPFLTAVSYQRWLPGRVHTSRTTSTCSIATCKVAHMLPNDARRKKKRGMGALASARESISLFPTALELRESELALRPFPPFLSGGVNQLRLFTADSRSFPFPSCFPSPAPPVPFSSDTKLLSLCVRLSLPLPFSWRRKKTWLFPFFSSFYT